MSESLSNRHQVHSACVSYPQERLGCRLRQAGKVACRPMSCVPRSCVRPSQAQHLTQVCEMACQTVPGEMRIFYLHKVAHIALALEPGADPDAGIGPCIGLCLHHCVLYAGKSAYVAAVSNNGIGQDGRAFYSNIPPNLHARPVCAVVMLALQVGLARYPPLKH